jgi:hypothetical protein
MDPMGGPPVRPKESYLFFLNQKPNRELELANTPGAILWLSIPKEHLSQVDGPQGLQADLRASLAAASSDANAKQWLNILSQFRNFDGSSAALLERLRNSPSPEISAMSLTVLAKSSPQPEAYVSALLALLVSKPEIGSNRPERFIDIISSLSQPNDLNNLEKLSNSSDPALRLSAVMAIRRLQLKESEDFLISLLDSPDRNIQYQAVIALAEITHIYGDYAPAMGVFFSNPTKTVQLWKNWAAKKSDLLPLDRRAAVS